jgi:hypothetical protein
MEILRFEDFLNESVYNVGVPVYRGTNFEPEMNIKRNRVIPEIQNFLSQIASGSLTELTVIAEIPSQGKNITPYLKDVYSELGYDPSKDKGIGDEPSKNVFVDSEFLVKDVDVEKGIIIATPYSLRKKDVLVELTPEIIEEIFVK